MLCNLSYIEKMSGGDQNFVRQMIGLFLKQVPLELDKLQVAIASSDLDQVKRITHKLKSSVAMVGAETMLSEIKKIDNILSNSTDGSLLWEPYNSLEKKFDEVRQELEPNA